MEWKRTKRHFWICIKETHINGSDLSETMKMVGHAAPRHSLALINNIIIEVAIEEKATAGRPCKLLYTTDLKQCKVKKF